jgi:hypothetical protein
MTDPQAPEEQPEAAEPDPVDSAGDADEAALADAQPTTAMTPGGGPAEAATQAVQPGSAPMEATQEMRAVPPESVPPDATQVVRPGDVAPPPRGGQPQEPPAPAWGQQASGQWGWQGPASPPPAQSGGFGAPGAPGVQAAFEGGGDRTKGSIAAVAGGVLGVLGAVLALVTWVLASGSIAQQGEKFCTSLSGSIAEECRQAFHIPTALVSYLIVIIVGGLVAAAGGVMLYLRNKIGSPVLVVGGVLMVLFSVIISMQYVLPWELFIALLCGVLALVIGLLAYLPQTSRALGLPSLLTARGSGTSAAGARPSGPGSPAQFGAAGQQWQNQPAQQAGGPPPQWAGPQAPPQPQQPPPWGAQPPQAPPPQQQNYPPPGW